MMQRWMSGSACALLLVCTLLAGCATQTSRITGANAAHSAAELSNWTASGKIGITGIEQSGSGNFNWAQQSNRSAVHFSGPLGMSALQIEFDGKQLTLSAADGTHYDAEQALDELQQRLGIAIPIMQLRYWMLGIAAPQDVSGAPQWLPSNTELQQAGWRIVYADWLQRGALRLPGKLTLTHDQLRVVMVVQSWRLD